MRLSARTIRASGQLAARAGLARQLRLPLRHLLLYAFPLASGDPWRGNYRPLTASRFDTFIETAVGVGPVAAGLALLGAADRRRRRLFGFAAAVAIAAGSVVYFPPVRRLAESAPLLSAGLLERVKVLVVFGLAIAAAIGAERVSEILEDRRGIFGRAAAALPFLVGLPLLAIAARVYPAVPPEEAVFRGTPGIRALERETAPGPSRILATGWTLYPDLAGPFGLEDVRGHLFFERGYRELLSAADPGIYGRTGTLLISDRRTLDPASPVLDLLGVSAVASAPGERPPFGLAKVYDGPDLAVYRRPAAFPRFFAVQRIRSGGIEDAVRASREILRTTAFVAPADASRLRAIDPAAAPPAVAVEARAANSFRLRVAGASSTLLVSSQKLFPPYWTARIDGKAAPPIRVDGLFFGVPVPPGNHVVEGRFRIPRSETALSAAAAVVLAVLGASALRRGARA